MKELKFSTGGGYKYLAPECRTVVLGTSCVLCGSLNGGLQDMKVDEFDWGTGTVIE